MTVFNIGSINVDHLYQIDHFVRPGETLNSTNYQQLLGGKGANQSVALAKAGADVRHVGALNRSDHHIIQQLQDYGVNTDWVSGVEEITGHAIIQLTEQAENAIILHAGANHALMPAQLDKVFQKIQQGDWLLLQNETNLVSEALQLAHRTDAKVAFNPAPMNVELTRSVLPYIDLLIVNEVEAMELAQVHSVAEAIIELPQQYPELAVMMTLGKEGVRYFSADDDEQVPGFVVEALDTTAAGDTFIGYCLAELSRGTVMRQAMTKACAAAAICVTRMGAAPSIPSEDEVNEFLAQRC